MKQIAEFSTPSETKILNELLSENKEKYSLYDIFKYLSLELLFNVLLDFRLYLFQVKISSKASYPSKFVKFTDIKC